MSGESVRHVWFVALVAVAVLLARCSCEDFGLENVEFACATDAECAPGFVCNPALGVCSVTAAPPDGGVDAGGGGCEADEVDESSCGDQQDNDCDGRVDCADPSCEDKSCSTNAALACRTGSCACAIADVELDSRPGGGGSVLSVEDRLRFIYAGVDGGVFYGECEGGCEAPSIITLDATEGAGFRPMIDAVGNRIIAGWRRGTGALVYGECAADCLDGGFKQAIVPNVTVSNSSLEVFGEGSSRGFAVVLKDGQGAWLECSGGCDQSTAKWTQVVLATGATRGAAGTMWMQDGVLHRRAAFGDPLVTTSCSGAGCTSLTAWTPNLVLDSDSFQPELQVAPGGRIAVFARNDALKKLNAFICEAGANCDIPQSWRPIVAFSYPTNTRAYDSSTSADGRFAFVTSGAEGIEAGEEVGDGFSVNTAPLCDGGSVLARRPTGFVDQNGRWTFLYHQREGSTRLYLPRP